MTRDTDVWAEKGLHKDLTSITAKTNPVDPIAPEGPIVRSQNGIYVNQLRAILELGDPSVKRLNFFLK